MHVGRWKLEGVVEAFRFDGALFTDGSCLLNVGNVLVPEKEMLSHLGGITIRDGWLILKPHV